MTQRARNRSHCERIKVRERAPGTPGLREKGKPRSAHHARMHKTLTGAKARHITPPKEGGVPLLLSLPPGAGRQWGSLVWRYYFIRPTLGRPSPHVQWITQINKHDIDRRGRSSPPLLRLLRLACRQPVHVTVIIQPQVGLDTQFGAAFEQRAFILFQRLRHRQPERRQVHHVLIAPRRHK